MIQEFKHPVTGVTQTYRTNPESKHTNPKDAVGVRKAPMSTVSAAVMAEVGVAMLEGAAKYGRHNYRAVGVRSSVYYDGTMRHLMAWWEGEDLDPDSQMSHITKAITSLVVLRDAMLQGMLTDDRPPRAAPFYPALNALAADLIDKHADKTPRHYTIEDSLPTQASDEGGWVDWVSPDPPVPYWSKVSIRQRDRTVIYGQMASNVTWGPCAQSEDRDVVAYRVEEDA